MTLGVRPEDVRIAAGPSRWGLEARFEVVEMLGDATVATLRAEHPIASDADTYTTHKSDVTYVRIKSEPRANLQAAMHVTLAVNPDRVHLFDPATGENCVRRPAGRG